LEKFGAALTASGGMLNAPRALASLEKTGAAVSGMAEGNYEFWMLDERERSHPLSRAKHIFNSKFKIQNTKFKIQNSFPLPQQLLTYNK